MAYGCIQHASVDKFKYTRTTVYMMTYDYWQHSLTFTMRIQHKSFWRVRAIDNNDGDDDDGNENR